MTNYRTNSLSILIFLQLNKLEITGVYFLWNNMDNYTSHTTHQFVKYCDQKKIFPFSFPPHTTHLLQPLDGVPFQSYKNFHRKVVNQQSRLGALEFDKIDFLTKLKDIRTKTFTQRIIRSGWSGRGIHPLNPDIILDKLQAKYDLLEEPILEIYDGEEQNIPSSPTNESFSPPETAYKLQKRIKAVEK